MIIGGMNHPANDPYDELQWMADMGLGFIDLTMEPPAAAPDKIDARKFRKAVDDRGMTIVGHTAYYTPIGSSFEEVRLAAVRELCTCLDRFAELGVPWVNIHPDGHAPFQERAFMVEQNRKSLRALAEHAEKAGTGVMIENMPGFANTAEEMSELWDGLPGIGMLLDIGHCNLRVEENTADDLLNCCFDRVKHVHLHDNRGGELDLHLPLGTGTVPYRDTLTKLKGKGYDGTITLEVFSPDKRLFEFSRDRVVEAWEAA